MKLTLIGVALLMAAARQDADARKTAESAVAKTRASSSYEVVFKATIKTPNSDPMVLEGRTVWVKPGVLYIHSTASGGDEKRIVRVGDRVYLYYEQVEDWVDAAEAGQSGAGRGIQNPDEVLAVLAGQLEKAAFAAERKGIRLSLAGADLEKVMKEQANRGSFDWASSNAEVLLELSPDGRLSRFTTTAQLASSDPALAGKKVDYSAVVEIASYERERELKFTLTDPKTKQTRPLEIPENLRLLIDLELKK